MNMGGYRDFTDMVDGGGAMARGGDFQGGGLIRYLGNIANKNIIEILVKL